MSGSNTIFSGNSRFAMDFQSIIDRSVAIASLPLQQLKAAKTTLSDQSTALSALDTKFAALQTAIEGLESATGLSSYHTSVSDGSIVKATLGDGALEGVYTVEVTGLGAATNTMSKDGLIAVANPASEDISVASSFTLTVNSTTYTITPEAHNLNALVDAINESGANVQASIVNIGSTASPDYRLSIQGTRMAADTIQLNDGTADLLNTLATGSNATYKVNGLATEIHSDSRTVTLAPGLTVDLLAESAPGEAATITVTRDTSGIQAALSSLVKAFNAAVDAVDAHRGKGAGALQGQSLVSVLGAALRDIGSWDGGSGTLTSTTGLGLVFDKEGHLSLDTTAFDENSVSAILDFLGSSSGGGFLKAAADVMDSIQDSSDGALPSAIQAVQDEIASQDDLIAANQDRIDLLRENLQSQMAAADAIIAALEQKVNYMNNLFEAMRINSQSTS